MPLTKEQRREIALRNLAKSWNRNKQPNGNSQAITETNTTENVNHDKLQVNVGELKRRELRTRFKRYLGGPDSVSDFEKLRRKSPQKALELAIENTWTKPTGNPSHSAPQKFNLFVQLLTGGNTAGPAQLGIDGKAITVQADQVNSPELTDSNQDNTGSNTEAIDKPYKE